MSDWVGVVLDGTLAEYSGWKGPTHIGAPIPKMVARVKKWLAEGREVRILTARAYPGATIGESTAAERAIEQWSKEQFGRALRTMYCKDYGRAELWNGRADGGE
jgi:hypothetical protein